jgi:hypothetical protein
VEVLAVRRWNEIYSEILPSPKPCDDLGVLNELLSLIGFSSLTRSEVSAGTASSPISAFQRFLTLYYWRPLSHSQPHFQTGHRLYHCNCLTELYRMMLMSIGFVAKPMAAPQVIDESLMKRDGHTHYQEALFCNGSWTYHWPLVRPAYH